MRIAHVQYDVGFDVEGENGGFLSGEDITCAGELVRNGTTRLRQGMEKATKWAGSQPPECSLQAKDLVRA